MIFADLGPLAVEVDGLAHPVNGRRLTSVALTGPHLE
jgi:hypothetical protein